MVAPLIAASAGQGAVKVGLKILPAVPVVFVAAKYGVTARSKTEELKGKQDPHRPMASTVNSWWAPIPAMSVGLATGAAAWKLKRTFPSSNLAAYGAAVLGGTAAGIVIGAGGAGGILQFPWDLARDGWSKVKPAWLPEIPTIHLELPNPVKTFNDLVTIESYTPMRSRVPIKRGEKFDVASVGRIPEGFQIDSVTEHSGYSGATKLSEIDTGKPKSAVQHKLDAMK